jgi:hypothetical protein
MANMVRVKTDNTERECINILVRHLANSHVQKKWDKNNFDTPFQIGEREMGRTETKKIMV